MDRYVGKRLDGRYEIQEIIGVGGMSVVYKARDNVENRIVAIKILKEEFVSNEEFVRRFKNESKAIAVLSHPNIVKVYDVSFGDLIQYIVMEYIDGITLKEYIERQGSLRWKDAVYFTIQILKGLQHAHDKGIVHRDVKPQNIMVLPDGTIKVADFGIARFARNEQRTMTDKAIGSVHYISPEQARGDKTDEKADIYSVGVLLYEMLTGQLPFEADSAVSVAIMQLQRDPKLPTEINPSIPVGLEQITMHAMQKLVDRRYQSASEMLCDLEQFKKDPSLTFENSYFVDDSPTKFVDTLMSSTPASAVEDEEVEEEQKEKNNMIPILAGIAAALIIAIIVLCIIFIPRLLKSTSPEIECPDFLGMTIEEVKGHELYDDFKIEFASIPNEEYPYGEVCDQSQNPGEKLKSGATITLYLSEGVINVEVPDVRGKTESYAMTVLKKEGFTVKTVEMASEEVEQGLVIKTEPATTTVVASGSEITIYVSSGEEVKMVKVPNVVGLTEERAKKDIEEAGLIVVAQTRDLTSDEKFYEKGRVISQEPDPNNTEQVLEGETIKIYVSTGVVNYTYTPTVTIPFDFVDYGKTGYISLWEDGKRVQTSALLDFEAVKSHEFDKITTTSKEKIYELKVQFKEDGDFYSFGKLKVNISEGSTKFTNAFDYRNYKVPKDDTSNVDKPESEKTDTQE